jgi:putative ABC transport system permease protein
MRLGTNSGFASFKIDAVRSKDLIAQIETKWKSMAAGLPFSYRFLDDSFNEMYRNEQRIGKLAISFAVLAIFHCMSRFIRTCHLYGLSKEQKKLVLEKC